MKLFTFTRRSDFLRLLVIICALLRLSPAQAQPTITSPPPANGVSPSAPLVFTFSEPMNTNVTEVTFQSIILMPPYIIERPTTAVWTGGDTVLTCTPSPAFPANSQIIWSAYGENPAGDPLGEPTGGSFTTGSGTGGGGGSGTNAITTFSVGKTHHYNQTSAGPSTLDPTTPYDFSGVTALSSNRTATNITLTLPTGGVSNLTQIPLRAELYTLYGFDTSLSTYDATFPAGDYSFLVKSVSSNQTVVVNLPTTNLMAQPGVPHVANYAAAQAVDPTQAFVLSWDAFPGGTAADYIDVDIGTYLSPEPGRPGALTGTATTFTIPAGTLQPNSNFLSRVGFFRFVGATNASYATSAFRATYTEFTLVTSGGVVTGPLVLTNTSWASGVFSFDVLCAVGQTLTVEYTDVLSAVNWTKLQTITNSPGTSVHIISPQAATNKFLFYRARNGP